MTMQSGPERGDFIHSVAGMTLMGVVSFVILLVAWRYVF
jgi:hypothetical protein